ncbi:hypothetical protein DAT35_08240 [Vitiosangium sp. GDMCC 1.1324]|nr:hypothetical protein DAT35_08240 [Vitiosangium sp. GDMCC 1.1324]
MKAHELLAALKAKLGTDSQIELAKKLGITANTLNNWTKTRKRLTPLQLARLLLKAQAAAIQHAQHHTIKPVVEHFKLQCATSARNSRYEIFRAGDSTYLKGLRKELDSTYGIYIFYDSGGRALYAGKARRQTLWKEINNAFNRERGTQMFFRVDHPSRNQIFKPQHKQHRQPYQQHLYLHELAAYFSAYCIDDGMIGDLEALIVRGFANDLLNSRMETFAHARY